MELSAKRVEWTYDDGDTSTHGTVMAKKNGDYKERVIHVLEAGRDIKVERDCLEIKDSELYQT